MSLASLASSISSGVGTATTSFADFAATLQQTMDDRVANFDNKVYSVVPGSQAASTTIQQGLNNGFANGQPVGIPGSALSGGFVDLSGSELYSGLQTMDTYKVHTAAANLQGLDASNEPLLPMTFTVVLPDQAIVDGVAPVDPFTLLINPKTWSRSSTKKNTNTFTRGGYKSERWGEDLEQIDASGDIGAYYTQQTGLTRLNNTQSPSYQNLLQLVQIFKNNGCYYGTSGNDLADNGIAPTSQVKILDVGYVDIFYGYEHFRGTFDGFSIKETADKPFSLSYSFTFFVAQIVSIYDSTSLTSSINIPTNTGGAEVPQSVQAAYENSSNAAVPPTPVSTLDSPNVTNALGAGTQPLLGSNVA